MTDRGDLSMVEHAYNMEKYFSPFGFVFIAFGIILFFVSFLPFLENSTVAFVVTIAIAISGYGVFSLLNFGRIQGEKKI